MNPVSARLFNINFENLCPLLDANVKNIAFQIVDGCDVTTAPLGFFRSVFAASDSSVMFSVKYY